MHKSCHLEHTIQQAKNGNAWLDDPDVRARLLED